MIKVRWNTHSLPDIIIIDEKLYKSVPRSQPYEKRDGIHRRDHEGWVDYFYSDGNPCGGFGGSTFEGRLTTGESFKYQGAWSSRAAVVNALWPENPIVDVVCGFRGIGMTVHQLFELYQQCESVDFGLCALDNDDRGVILAPWKASEKGPDIGPRMRGTILHAVDGSNLDEIPKLMEAFKCAL